MLGATAGAAILLPDATWATEIKSMAKMPAPGHKLLIAHRGASSYAPENTLVAYELAIKQGADLVEQDLQITKDGILICSHDTTLEATTNVEEVFPDRFKERDVKGKKVKYWPIYDFTLAEIKKLKTGSRTEGEFPTTSIPTWQEAIDTIRGKAGLCPETKGEALYGKLGFNMEELVAALLKKNGLAKRDSDSRTPILMQSFSKDGLLNLLE
jgi:glycerophosphoryl diester phosphodiesterase